MTVSTAFFQRPLELTSRFVLPSRAILSPLEGIMNRDQFFRAARSLELIDSWMPPFLGVPPDAPPKTGALRKRLGAFLASGVPLTVQLLGHDPASMAAVCRTLFHLGVNSVNLNCACPSPTVLGSRSGGALLKNPDLLRSMIAAIRTTVPELCVSVKLRTGFLSDAELPVILRAVEAGGAHWVILHFRTVTEKYEPVPRETALRRFRQTRECLGDRVPFFANGDIGTPEDAFPYVDCGCAGVAVGRGILNDPFLLRKLRSGALPGDFRPEFLARLTDGLPGKSGRHYYLECVKMAYGRDSAQFRAALEKNIGRA